MRDLLSGKLAQSIENAADEGGLQSRARGRRHLRGESAAEFFFDAVIEGEHAQSAVVGKKRPHQSTAERLAGGFDQQHRMFACGRGIQQSLKDGRQVSDRDLLVQELLQDFLHFTERERFGNEFFDERGMTFAEAVEQTLGLLTVKQFVGMLANDFRQVRGEDGSLIDDRIAR